MGDLLLPRELDAQLRYPTGKCAKLARQGKLPHLKLPDGQIRFDIEEVSAFLRGDAHYKVEEVTDALASS